MLGVLLGDHDISSHVDSDQEKAMHCWHRQEAKTLLPYKTVALVSSI